MTLALLGRGVEMAQLYSGFMRSESGSSVLKFKHDAQRSSIGGRRKWYKYNRTVQTFVFASCDMNITISFGRYGC